MKSGSLEKGEAYVFEEDAQDKDRVPSPPEEDIYQFLLSYQQNNAGRLVLDPKWVFPLVCFSPRSFIHLTQVRSCRVWGRDGETPQTLARRNKDLVAPTQG